MVSKSLYHAARVNVSRSAFFSSRSEKKTIFFDVDIVVKNKSKCSFSWYVLLSITSTRHYSFPKHFSNCFRILSEFAKVFERVWRVKTAHLPNAARALSNPSRCVHIVKKKNSFLWYWGKKQTFWPLWWRVSLSIKLYYINTSVLLGFLPLRKSIYFHM